MTGLAFNLLGLTFSLIFRVTGRVAESFLGFTFNVFSCGFSAFFDRHNGLLPCLHYLIK